MKIKYTRLQLVLELLGGLLLLGMIIYLCSSWHSIPEKVPAHYGASGEITRWGDKGELLLLPLLGIFIYSMITIVSFFPNIWNFPVTIPEKNKAAVFQCMKTMILVLKIEVLGVFFFLTCFSVSMRPLPPWFLPVFIVALSGSLIGFLARSLRLSKYSVD